MTSPLSHRFGLFGMACAFVITVLAAPARADELWVAPTYQQDVGGLGIGSNGFWPVTPVGAVRLAWAVPNDVQTFQSAKLVLIPHAPGGAATLNVFICAAQNGNPVAGACAGPLTQPFIGVANQLLEVDLSAVVGPRVGTPGANYLTVVAYTTPTTATDHIVGLRFAYARLIPPGAATLTENVFNGTQQIHTGNLNLDIDTTPTAGMLTKDSLPFLHNRGTDNTFLGLNAGNLTLGGHANTGVGRYALFETTTGFENTAVGRQALGSLRDGIANTAVGSDALKYTVGGNGNTGIGRQALYANTNGYDNTAVGLGALYGNTTGGVNTAMGWAALFNNTTGSGNTGLGESALVNNGVGYGNTAVGARTLDDNATGHDNTAVGVDALNLTTGSSNTAVGANAGGENFTGDFNLYLHSPGQRNESFTTRIGEAQTRTFIAGIRNTVTGTADAIPVVIDSAGQLGTVSSSRRFKDDIHDMTGASSRIFKLRPVTFRYKQAYGDGSTPIQYGLIAEEVAEVFPELAVRNAEGEVETVHYETLNVLLLNELQKQRGEQQKQEQRIEALEQRINEILDRRATDGAR